VTATARPVLHKGSKFTFRFAGIFALPTFGHTGRGFHDRCDVKELDQSEKTEAVLPGLPGGIPGEKVNLSS
jgi:hypothetical protein